MVNEKFKDIIKEYSDFEIFENLKNDSPDDFVKIFSIINISKINSIDEFKILIHHLTNHSTPIREITALKLEEISKNEINFFLNDFSKDKIIDAITDINPNVSRAICSIINDNIEIQDLIREGLVKKIEILIEDIKDFQIQNQKKEQKTKKSHAKNKKFFALYWYLEALYPCLNDEINSKVLEIINFTIDFYDYTIREKTAKILTKVKNLPSELLQKAKSDQNFYVKNLVYDKIYNEV